MSEKYNNENFTVLVSTNDVGRTHQLQISKAWLKASIVLVILSSILTLSGLFDYVSLLVKSPEHDQVRTEYQYLVSNLQYVESELKSLEAQLKKVKELTDKIEIINNYFNSGPMQTMSTQTEFLNDDIVAKEGYRGPESLGFANLKRERLVKASSILPTPLISKSVFENDEISIDTMSDRIELAVQDSQVLEHKVLQLWENLSERQNFLRATPSIRPARGWFSSRFGIRADPFTGRPTMHTGLDIAGSYGTPVHATADGVVSFAGWKGGYGNLVTIDHGYGIKTRYAHNSKIYVKPGQKIKRLDIIAAMGNTGRSTSTHSHYEVRVRGVAVDPINYVLDF